MLVVSELEEIVWKQKSGNAKADWGRVFKYIIVLLIIKLMAEFQFYSVHVKSDFFFILNEISTDVFQVSIKINSAAGDFSNKKSWEKKDPTKNFFFFPS